MYPFYNFNNGFRRVHRLDRAGIPVMQTIYVTTSANNDQVTYGICPILWRQLPNEGIMLLNIQHSPSSTATAEASVLIDPTTTTSRASNSSNVSAGGKALLNGSGEQMINEEITAGNRYFIYYNKCNGTFQTVNHIVVPTTATN